MPSKVTIQNGQFQDAAGNAVNGTLTLRLIQDAVVTGTGTVVPGDLISIVVTAGNAAATPIWGTDNLTPSGLVYVATVYDSSGGRVWGPENWSITGAGPIEINTLTPSSAAVAYPTAIITNPSADQTISVDNLLPAAGNTTQSLGKSGALWEAALDTATAGTLNGVVALDGLKFTTLAAAVAAVPASGGECYVPTGTTAPTAAISCANPMWIHGAGINETIIKPTSALAGALLSFTTTGEGVKISDLTIDMSNVTSGAQDAIVWNGPAKPIIENVRIIYPAGATGKALNISNVGECHVTNFIVKQAGYGVYINGDGGAEHFFTDVVVESPTTVGFDVERTTTTDVGGWYLLRVKVTNPFSQNGSVGIKLNSTTQNTALPTFMTDCVADTIVGGHSLYINNVNDIQILDLWSTNTALLASNFSAVYMNNVSQVNMFGGHLSSNSRDMTLSGNVGECKFVALRFLGTNTNIYAAGVTGIPDTHFSWPLLSAGTPMSAADEATIAGAGNSITPISCNAGEVWVKGGNNSASFRLINKESGATNPIKGLQVGSTGDFKVVNNAGSTAIFSVTDAGAATFATTLTATNGVIAPTSASSAVFALDTSAGGSISIANNATATPFGNANNFSGLFLVEELLGGTSALFLNSGNTMVLISQTGTSFSTTSGTAAKANVFVSTSVVTIENKLGSTVSFLVTAIRTHTSQ